jgi:Cdc6-like AAA superfamily ATPase
LLTRGNEIEELEEKMGLLRALSLTNPLDDLAAIRGSQGERVEGTCEWILAQEEFVAWVHGGGRRQFQVTGAPGIGKMVVSTFLVDELGRKAKQPLAALAYYFCDYKDYKRSTATAILRGLILQLLKRHPVLFCHFQPDYDVMRKSLFDNLDALWRILLNMLADSSLREIYILIDALDECEETSR